VIPPGTLDVLILQVLSRERNMHGFEIAEFIRQGSEGVLRVEEGSLYPALHRLLVKGWLAAEWGKTAENHRARYYRLTPAGKKQLQRELQEYWTTARAIARVLIPA
jgi:PadR family transcriptional regulator, regulatory protein PadR